MRGGGQVTPCYLWSAKDEYKARVSIKNRPPTNLQYETHRLRSIKYTKHHSVQKHKTNNTHKTGIIFDETSGES